MALPALVEPHASPRAGDDRPTGVESGPPLRALPARNGTKVQSVALTIVAVVAGVAALRLADALLIPIVLTLMVTAGLAPFVRGIERLGVTRWLASAVAVLGLLAAVGGGTYALSDDVAAAINQLPEATSRLQQELRQLRRQSVGPIRALERAADNIEAVASEATGARPAARPATAPALRLRESLVMGTMTLVGFTGGVVMFSFLLYFILASGDMFKRKLVHIAGPALSDRRATVEILLNVRRRVERFVLVILASNVFVALFSCMSFWALGLNHAITWGLVGGVLNTIPYFGSAVAAGVFFLAGLLQFDRLDMALLVSGAFLFVTTIESSWLTPRFLGKVARMNNVAVFVALLFWGWVWGAWGLLLAYPMTVVIKTASDQIESLKPVGELLGE
jgi:predicted PurR-regulated permease PerM